MIAVVKQYTIARKKENVFYEKNDIAARNLVSKFQGVAAGTPAALRKMGCVPKQPALKGRSYVR